MLEAVSADASRTDPLRSTVICDGRGMIQGFLRSNLTTVLREHSGCATFQFLSAGIDLGQDAIYIGDLVEIGPPPGPRPPCVVLGVHPCYFHRSKCGCLRFRCLVVDGDPAVRDEVTGQHRMDEAGQRVRGEPPQREGDVPPLVDRGQQRHIHDQCKRSNCSARMSTLNGTIFERASEPIQMC